MSRRATSTLAVGALVAGLAAVGGPAAAQQTTDCATPSAPMTFASSYIDEHRAGGEPIVTTHPDGGLLWGSHAGTTHFYSPAAADTTTAAFLENYQGQTYQYRSDDAGASWDFIDRTPISSVDPVSGLPNSGFSDPEFAIDLAGNVYISEINLANIAVSKSSDGGRTYALQSLAEITMSDRQWMEADEEDVLWFVANTFGGGSTSSGNPVTGRLGNDLYKSTDGGKTFSAPQSMGGQQSSDIDVDKATGALYQLHSEGSSLRLWAARNARKQSPPNVDFDVVTIANNYNRKSTIGPTMDVDAYGNIFVVWDDNGSANRERGIWFTYSLDGGKTFAQPGIKLDQAGKGVAFWPWIAAGDEGAVAVWLQHDDAVTGNEPQNAKGDWRVMTSLIRACDTDAVPGVDRVAAPTAPVRAWDEPIHRGTICTGGTTCQAMAIDRRLGDYFANAIDRDGNVYISVSDTMSGGSVSLPRVIRQTGGPTVGDLYADEALWGDVATRVTAPAAPTAEACATGLAGLFRSVTSFLGLSGRC